MLRIQPFLKHTHVSSLDYPAEGLMSLLASGPPSLGVPSHSAPIVAIASGRLKRSAKDHLSTAARD